MEWRSLKIDLTPEQEARLATKARRNGVGVDDYLHRLVEGEAFGDGAGIQAPAPRAKYDREALLTLLDDLENTDKYGTAEEQRETLEYLKQAIDANRPGQRRVFGPGNNPA